MKQDDNYINDKLSGMREKKTLETTVDYKIREEEYTFPDTSMFDPLDIDQTDDIEKSILNMMETPKNNRFST